MTKYENKVRERAEEFAKLTNPTTYKRWFSTSKTIWDETVNKYLELARISLQREAEAYTLAYTSGRDRKDEPYNTISLNQQLQSMGLVP